ncbi:MAG: hypothetical protein AB7T49_03510 [Oligoflexales bacterium]
MLAKSLTLMFWVIASASFGKGLDSLTPEVAPPEQEAKEPASTEGSQSAPATETPTAPAPAATPPVVEATPPVEPVETAPTFERSNISKAIENKMYLGTGIDLGALSASKGDWTAASGSHLVVGYKFQEKPGTYDLYGTFRYTPFDVVVRSSSESYTGIVEGYHFGAEMVRPWKEKWEYTASAELGYWKVTLEPSDSFTKDSDLEKRGVTATAGGGLNWLPLNKVKIGPRVSFGFGRFQSYRVSAVAAFAF